ENGFPVTTTIYGTVRTETVVETATDAVTPDNVTKITETESSLGLFLPEDPLPYVPGGLAVCPWSHVIYVSDNTNGRLLMINPYETEHRAITLLEGLDHPGDVDIGCGGRSLVYTDGNRVKSMLFGFTVYLRGEDALPLRGAEVTVQTGLGQFIRKTDDRGYLTLLNLTDPSVYDNSVALTVKSGGKTQIYTFNLERSCHTFKALVFAGNGSVTPVFYQSGPYSHYKPPYGVCAGVEGEDPPAEKPEKKEIKQRIRTNKTVALQPIYTFRSEVATQPLVPPTIVLTSPADGQETSEAEQLIAGWVSDKSVTEVMIEINGTTYTIPVVGQRFAQNFTLGSGKSRISARASNVSGYAAQSEPVEVTVPPGSAVDSGGAVGQVVDSATGKGASDVVVTETASGRNAVTDASGYYSFAGLPAGEASFVVQ
ncbi:MAG TPA: hypothetical protein PLP17_07965, partial [Oligoflexia bacterium]|nr:hypothetical protein [Oligoflexia bacterium]